MDRDIYSIGQYCFAPSIWRREQPGVISPKNIIKGKHIERNKNSFVTHLHAIHTPTEEEKKYTADFLYRLERTDSIREASSLIRDVMDVLNNMQKDLCDMRQEYFKVIDNEGEVYGVLRKAYTELDRDRYIRKLVLYYDISKELLEILNRPILKNSQLPLLHPGSGVYGDLQALERLRQNELAELPDLTYNRGRWQVV